MGKPNEPQDAGFYLTGVPERESEEFRQRPENQTSFYTIPIQRERNRKRILAFVGALLAVVSIAAWLVLLR